MRISVVFDGSCRKLHISPHQTVGTIKKTIRERFCVQLSEDDKVQRYLELRFAGAALQDSWCLADMGITSGSTVLCQEVNKAILHVFSAITKETHPIMGPVTLLGCFVSTLKSLVSLQLGLPVSSFRLSTRSGIHLYDCNLLSDYAVQSGGILLLEPWEGWNEFLRACFRGHKQTAQHHLSEEKPVLRFQKRVALYVAAAHGHIDMASWLINNGVKAKDPVGVHPNRTWCQETDHLDTIKCPTHAAVEAGQLLILKLFASNSIANLACCHPSGRNLLQIAIQHRHKHCVTYLVSKLYTTVNFPGCSFPMLIYLQIKTWIHKAQTRQRQPMRGSISAPLQVDGFPMQKKSSNLRGKAQRGYIEVKDSSCGLPVTSSFVPSSCACHHPAAPPSQTASIVLPQLHPPHSMKRSRRGLSFTMNRACGMKNPKEILPAENSNGSVEAWWSKGLLPCSFPDIAHRHFPVNGSSESSKMLDISQEIFQVVCGQTLRQNAMYCLAIASDFTEKPWRQQLTFAQMLARRSVQNILRQHEAHTLLRLNLAKHIPDSGPAMNQQWKG